MDFSSFSDEDLEEFIRSMGIDGVAGGNREELESLLASMLATQQGHTTGTASNESIVRSSDLDTAMIMESSDMQEDIVSSSVVDLTEEAQHSVSVPNPEEEMKLANFVGITGSDPESARGYLDAMGWDLNSAVSLYLEGNTTPSMQHSSTTTFSSAHTEQLPSSVAQQTVNPLSAAFERVAAEGLSGGTSNANFMEEALRHMQQMHHMMDDHGMTDEDEDYHYPGGDEYDEEGVRRPDRVRIQQLLPTQRFQRFASSNVGRLEDPSVEWMFPPPTELSFPEDFDKAKDEASNKDRWLLVSLQSHDEFSSHRLNRDTWSNDTLQSLLGLSYLFWQRGHTSRDGQEYMRLYHLTADQLPHIAIINPITGAKVKDWKGFVSPEDLSLALVEFADDHSLAGGGMLKRKFLATDNATGTANASSSSSSTASAPLPMPAQQSAPMPPAPPIVAAAVAMPNFGVTPSIPADDDATAIKISIKLASGKAINRKYLKSDLVKALFAVVVESDPASASRPFELISRYPAANLSTCLDKTLEESQLANGLVLHRYV